MAKKLKLALCGTVLLLGALTITSSRAQETETPKAEIGGPLINIELSDVNGGYSKLSSYVNRRGKYLLVNFWTSNCPRCHAGFVEIEKYAAAYADSLNIVGVHISYDDAEGWKEMYKYDSPFPWPNLSEDKEVRETAAGPYNISLYPTYVLVDQKGTILRKWSGFQLDKFEEQLKPWFAPLR